MWQQIIEFDEKFGTICKEALYGTPTHTSFYNAVEEAAHLSGIPPEIFNSEATAFVDLGSGTGSPVFYMFDRYPAMKRYVGVEFHGDLVREAERRRDALHFPAERIEFVHRNILTLDADFFESLGAKHLIVFSFDTVMPRDVWEHMKTVLLKVGVHTVWLSNRKYNTEGERQLEHRLVIGPAGVLETDTDKIIVFVSGETDEPGPSIDAYRKLYAESVSAKKDMVEMNTFRVHMHTIRPERMGCSVCGLFVQARCAGCPRVYCSQTCANDEWNTHRGECGGVLLGGK